MQQSAIWSGKSGNAYVTVRYDLGAPAPALPAVCVAVRGGAGRRRVVAVLAVDDARAAFGPDGAPGQALARQGADEVHLWFDVGRTPVREEIAADLAAALGPFRPDTAPTAARRRVA
ncbi:MAG: hypothetical protein ACU0DT_06755 [Albimonas sp.]|uniref:hypothetical protein n=1 Tax=Albimonas sp. TaxID=1872425 RepID=UPI00405643F2